MTEARRQKQITGDGNIELTTRQVDNPYRKGKTEIVPFNARESNARTLRLGTAQEAAYNHVWRLWYKAGHHANGAMDTSREPVDGGGANDPLPLKAFEAAQELNNLRKSIGKHDWRLIEITCLDGLNYREVATLMFGTPTQTQKLEASWHVKSAYNRLTVELGLAGTPSHFARLHNI